MASTPASSPGSVVIDANVLIATCAREKDKFDKAQDINSLIEIDENGAAWIASGNPEALA